MLCTTRESSQRPRTFDLQTKSRGTTIKATLSDVLEAAGWVVLSSATKFAHHCGERVEFNLLLSESSQYLGCTPRTFEQPYPNSAPAVTFPLRSWGSSHTKNSSGLKQTDSDDLSSLHLSSRQNAENTETLLNDFMQVCGRNLVLVSDTPLHSPKDIEHSHTWTNLCCSRLPFHSLPTPWEMWTKQQIASSWLCSHAELSWKVQSAKRDSTYKYEQFIRGENGLKRTPHDSLKHWS